LNQAILFNDDLTFDTKEDAWRISALLSGQTITVYFHSLQLKNLEKLDSCTKFDLEEAVEIWLEKNELDGDTIHLDIY
jgi:hypothetical protein